MEELRNLIIHYLTADTKEGYATAVFKETGESLWNEITLDMIMYNFDRAAEELQK